jgi:hypothetical protein
VKTLIASQETFNDNQYPIASRSANVGFDHRPNKSKGEVDVFEWSGGESSRTELRTL